MARNSSRHVNRGTSSPGGHRRIPRLVACAALALAGTALAAEEEDRDPLPLTGAQAEALWRATGRVVPALDDHVCTVGRVGLETVVLGVRLDAGGHLLAPSLDPIDDQAAPYVLYAADGTRVLLETVEEREASELVLLKAPPGGAPSPLAPAASLGACHWVLTPSYGAEPRLGERPLTNLRFARRGPEKDGDALWLEGALDPGGSFAFDLAGRLAGVITDVDAEAESSVLLPLPRLAASWRSLEEVLSPAPAGTLPTLPRSELTESTGGEPGPLARVFELQAKRTLPDPAPLGIVRNKNAGLTGGILGTVVAADGLVLTKASALGGDLEFLFEGQVHAAALLAEDPATDLALVAVDARELPTVQWAEGTAQRGEFVATRTFDLEGAPAVKAGLFGEPLGRGPTLHSIEDVTSLGFVPEQTSSGLRVAAVREGGAASNAGLLPEDEVVAIDEEPVPTRAALVSALTGRWVGETVTVRVRREDEAVDLAFKLGPAWPRPEPTGIRADMDEDWRIPSPWRGPFDEVLVHGLPLHAWECGGPLFGADGRALGINIAAVSSRRAHALSAAAAQDALARMTKAPILR